MSIESKPPLGGETNEHDRPPQRGEDGFGLYHYLQNQDKTTERDFLERLLLWDKKWPKSFHLMPPHHVTQAETELDDLLADIKESFNAEV